MIPNYQECMLPFLQLLSDNQIHTSKECVEKLSANRRRKIRIITQW